MSKDKFFNDYRFVFPKRKSKDNLLINFLYGTTKYGKTQKKKKKIVYTLTQPWVLAE